MQERSATAQLLGYCLLNAAGKMHWDEECCIWHNAGDAEQSGELETLQHDDPDGGWHVAPFGTISERTNVPTAEAERQLGLAYDMLKSCVGTPFTVAERDQCQGHIREAFRMLRGDLAAAEATARAAEAAWRDAERYRVLREHGGDGCIRWRLEIKS